ncbi:hypothetical protein [Yinghuangia seranimata]|uniref:hypothetical protein n=1 Tax=Yinghuangia seranimata TaxID=408067 RepID=UPI00248C3658|nr:hypothetical protein [Yinghuangia seranimata]MDI2132230.1 hypothetical protein [Yinghuangia seranimata]
MRYHWGVAAGASRGLGRRAAVMAAAGCAVAVLALTGCNADKGGGSDGKSGSGNGSTAVPSDIASIMAGVESAADKADSDAAAGDGDG